MMDITDHRILKRTAALLMCAAIVFAALTPLEAGAASKGKTVRVGWYESSFNKKDDAGRRSGYAYEYQMKVAAYTGWNYEYVEGSWSDLMDMLKKGEIDMMSDVSYTDERASQMLFPDLPMGSEVYYIFTSPANKEIRSDDYSTLNGKKIGINKGSIQEEFYREWASQHGVDAEVVELTTKEDESISMLQRGEIDAYITPDAFSDPEKLVPVCKIGSSDFFFVICNGREDLLDELNAAMGSIQEENRYYNQQMSDKYLIRAGVNTFLNADEKKWLGKHGTVKVGYQDNYLAFCAKDPETGELTGALRDYLDYASDGFGNAHMDYAATAYPTAAEALDALNRGEVDCVFPANLSSYDGEKKKIVMTPPMITTDVLAVVRQGDREGFKDKKHVVVAVNEGNLNYDAFLKDNYPEWRAVYYPDTGKCLRAVADGVADCVLISNYRYSNLSRDCERLGLTTIDTGAGVEYCFAVNNGDKELYSILTKITGLVPRSTISTDLSYYLTEDAKSTFGDFIRSNLQIFLIVLMLITAVIAALMVKSRKAEKKAKELISATETDRLTGLYNRDFFLQYASRMHSDHPDKSMDAIVCNIEQFHAVNAMKGRDFGDEVLRTLGREMKKIASENGGIAGRFGADRFDIFCRHIGDHQAVYDRLQGVLDELSGRAVIRLRMGVMQSQPELDTVEIFDMARTACSMSRGHFKEHLIVFDDKVREREEHEQRLMNDYRRALDGFEFEVYYQPKYNIQRKTPKLQSAEALVRWRHPELGMIQPDEFIPLLERNGKISELDRYVWNEAARQIVRWKEMYGKILPVSVNLSRVDVFDPSLEDTLEEILAINGLDHRAIMLEVTESAYTEDSDQVIKVVKSLRDRGYEVEMDDFGTGCSSLSMLSEMPVDVIKMDRNFVRNMEHDEKDAMLVTLILDIAKQLSIPVVAEGVETKTQLDMLKKMGCDVAQGYYFSRPLSAAEFENRIIQESLGRKKN